MSLWGFRDNVVEAVAFQDAPSNSSEHIFSPLTTVHVAKGLVPSSACDFADAEQGLVDKNYLAKLGHLSKLEEWQLICNQHIHE